MTARWVALAEVTKPHGIRGEVRVKLYNSDSDLLPQLPEVLVRPVGQPERMMTLDFVRGADLGHFLVKFQGIDDRDDTEALRGATLLVARDQFPELGDGEFYVCDVVGARLVGPDGDLGTVQSLVSYPTADALVVTLIGEATSQTELPLIEDFIERVDVGNQQVLVKSAAVEFLAATKSHAN